MEHFSKLNIYKGIIQQILDLTHYTLKNIADLSGASLDSIRSIYCQESIPINFKTEIQLLKFYQIVIEINMNLKKCCLAP